MSRPILISFCSLLLAACNTTPTQPDEVPKRSVYTMQSDGTVPTRQQNLQVKHADLHFKVFPQSKSISGTSTLTLVSDVPKTEISVDLDALFTIESVALNGVNLAADAYRNPEGELIINLPQAQSGEFQIAVSYYGVPREAVRAPWDGGFVWSKTADGQDWIATAVQGEGCDLFWACIDRPQGEPQSLDMYISVPANLTAAANGVFKGSTDEGDYKVYHWHSDTPQNTYGVALNIAPYALITETHQSIYGNQIPVHYYHLPQNAEPAKALVEEMHSMLDFFERVIGPYPFAADKMGIAETPHLGMEHQSINAYGNEYRKDPYGFDWLLQHEFAHEWFANQLTNKNADDMWLHEGFGAYMQPLYAEYLHGNMAYMAYLFKQRSTISNQSPLVSHKPMAVEEVYSPETGPGGDIYVKGSLVLHSLRQLMGDEKFFRAVRELTYGTATPQPGNFAPLLRSTDDFVQIVNQVMGKDLRWFFDVYVFNAPLPHLNQQRDNSALTLAWQTQNDLPFPMPLEVSINGKVSTLSLPATLDVTPADVVIIDPFSKVLKAESRVDNYQTWMQAQQAKQQKP